MKPVMKGTLSLSVIVLFATGCSTTQPAAMNESPQPVSYVDPAGTSGSVGITDAQGATGATAPGLAMAEPAGGANVEPSPAVRSAFPGFNLNLHVYGFSYHPDQDGVRRAGLDNELNVGLGLNYTYHEDARGIKFAEAGVYRDSGSNWAKVAGMGYQFKLGERLRLGGALAGVYSPTYNLGKFFVAPLPIATYDFGAVKLNAIYVLRYKEYNQFAVFGVYFSIPLGR